MEKVLQKIEDGLMNSPLFHLSLTNKELFHSNFLAWLGNTYKNEFKVLINELLDPDAWPKGLQEFSIDREYDHFDLCVRELNNGELGNPRIVIENKVKSVPTKEQLVGYSEKDSVKDCNLFILLTMTLMETPEKWRIITYKDLSDKLSKINLPDLYHSELKKDYCDYIANLQSVIEYFDKKNSYYSTADEDKLMKELGIHDICGKRKVQISYYNLVEKLKLSGYNVVNKESDLTNNNSMVGWGFTNSQPLIEVKLKAGNDNIFIQIQGKQYRHAVEYFDEKIGDRIIHISQQTNKKRPVDYKPSEKGLKYLLENYSYIFTSFDGKCQPMNYPSELVNRQFGQTNGYCKYCNGKQIKGKISCFVHQWIEIPQNTTMENLVTLIVSDVNNMIKKRNEAIQKK